MTDEVEDPAVDPVRDAEPTPVSAPAWVDQLCRSCVAETKRLQQPGARFVRSFRLHGHRRHSELTRLSAAVVHTVQEAPLARLTADEQRQFEALLVDAVDRLAARDGIAGWESLKAARRVGLGALDQEGRRVAAAVVRAEVDQKLTSWRKSAALKALAVEGAGKVPSVTQLRAAQAQLDEESTNTFRRLEVFGSVLTYILFGLVAALVVFLVAVGENWLPMLEGAGEPLSTQEEVVGVFALGAIGSFLSVALTRFAGRQQDLPQMVQGRLVDILRPLVGGASAIALVLVLDSGLQAAVETDGSKLYVWALVAGFSERLLRRSLTSIADTVKSGSAGSGDEAAGTGAATPAAPGGAVAPGGAASNG